MRKHTDHRRIAYCDLFDTPGDVNLFIVAPHARTCWHRHQRQTDQFRVIRGAVRFGIVAPGGGHSYHVLSRPDWAVKVEPNHWHGYENVGDDEAWILMYLSEKYDVDDEEKATEDEIPWHPSTW